MSGELIVQLLYHHAPLARTRLKLRHTLSHAVGASLAGGGAGVLHTRAHVRTARHVLARWRAYLRRPRQPVASFARRRLHTDDTPILPFG